MKRGLNTGIDYLKSFAPMELVPDALYKRAGVEGLVSSLGHSLRREARKPDNTNRVRVIYKPDQKGQDVAYYAYNPDYVPATRPQNSRNRAGTVPPLYFCSILGSKGPSGYFDSIEALLGFVCGRGAVARCLEYLHVWTGSAEAPVPVNMAAWAKEGAK